MWGLNNDEESRRKENTVRYQAVRDNLDKLTKCHTMALGAGIYASDSEVKMICYTCKSRFCPGCGNRATLTWQRERGCDPFILLDTV
jgi:hypothetical protein